MAFNVNFWTFSKKEKSTAQPTGQGTVYSCTANEPLDLLAPVISLKLALNTASPPTVYNYARIANFNRYYWVTGWEIRDGLWRASLRVDVLASWKTEIGSNSLYVYRSSHDYDLRIPDTSYPQRIRPRKLTIDLPKMFTVGGENAAGASSGSYMILAGIISDTGTHFYAFTQDQWEEFYAALFSNQYYTDVLGVYGATEYPEAKVAINPLQYISSAVIVPMGMSSFINTTSVPYTIPYNQNVGRVPVGNVKVPSADPGHTIAKRLPEGVMAAWTHTVLVTSDFLHPQADPRGDWLNYSPYTEYSVFYPPIGEIPLEPSVIAEADSLNFTVRVDFRAGMAMLDITAEYDGPPAKSYQMFRGEFAIGVPMQLTNVQVTGANSAYEGVMQGATWLQSNLGTMGESIALAASKVPVVGSIWGNGIQSAIHGATPHLSVKGRYGSTANMGGQPRLVITQWYIVDEDNPGRGRPLCAIRQISNIPGFITGEADELSIGCTEQELSEIRQSVSAGFFYE